MYKLDGLEVRVLKENSLESILDFEKAQLADVIEDPMERELAQWHAPWRQEALEHYLKLGWSFAAFKESSDELAGLILCQPMLFARGYTQTLWVEYLSVSKNHPDLAHTLFDIAYRTAREKHLQTLLFWNAEKWSNLFVGLPSQTINESLVEVKTAKIR